MENQNSVFSRNCEKCGKTLYEGEMLNIKGKYICEPCADFYVFASPGASRKKRVVPSPFFHFIFSLHPGAGQMYLGLMKRGLFQMCLFYLSIYMTAVSMPAFFGLAIPIVYLYSFFDSLVLKRRLASGEHVPDSIGGVASFLNGNKWLVIAVVLIMLSISAFSALFGYLGYNRTRNVPHIVTYSVEHSVENTVESVVTEAYVSSSYSNHSIGRRIRMAAPIALIAIGGLIVLKSVRRKRFEDTVEIIDYADKGNDFN